MYEPVYLPVYVLSVLRLTHTISQIYGPGSPFFLIFFLFIRKSDPLLTHDLPFDRSP